MRFATLNKKFLWTTLKQLSSNLAPEMFITKETKWHLLLWQQFCSWSCLNFNWNSQFVLIKDDLLQPFCWREVRQYGNHVCSKQNPLSHFTGLKIRIFGFCQRENWAQEIFHGNYSMHVIWFLLRCTFLVPARFVAHCYNNERYSLRILVMEATTQIHYVISCVRLFIIHRISLRWPIYIVNWVEKTKLSFYKTGANKYCMFRDQTQIYLSFW